MGTAKSGVADGVSPTRHVVIQPREGKCRKELTDLQKVDGMWREELPGLRYIKVENSLGGTWRNERPGPLCIKWRSFGGTWRNELPGPLYIKNEKSVRHVAQ